MSNDVNKVDNDVYKRAKKHDIEAGEEKEVEVEEEE